MSKTDISPAAVLPGRSFRLCQKVVTLIRRDRSGSGLFKNEATGSEDWMKLVTVENWITSGVMVPLGVLKHDDTDAIESNDSAGSDGDRLDQGEDTDNDGHERRPAGDSDGRDATEDQSYQPSGLDRSGNPATARSGRPHDSIGVTTTMTTDETNGQETVPTNEPAIVPSLHGANNCKCILQPVEDPAATVEGDPTTQTVTLDDGRIIDLETGECIGVEVPAEYRSDDKQMTDGLADWAMSKLLRHDSRIVSASRAMAKADAMVADLLASFEDTPEMIEARAMQHNAQKITKDASNALAFFHAKYDFDLGKWAAMNLGTSKVRTWKANYGHVSLTTVSEGLEVKNPDLAIDWAKRNNPKAVKETFMVGELTKIEKANLIADTVEATAAGFEVTPASEKVKVKTNAGLALEAEAKQSKKGK